MGWIQPITLLSQVCSSVFVVVQCILSFRWCSLLVFLCFLVGVFIYFLHGVLTFVFVFWCVVWCYVGYAWDALLRFTQIELQLLTDVDMHLFVEAGLRGGISMASQRYGKANNPTMDQYNSAEPTSYLLYLDANNLYGWAMCQSMPTSEFAWCDKNLSEILAHPVDSSTGFIVECDLEVPSSLHHYFNDYPLAPEVMRTFSDKLSPYQQALVEELKVSAVDGVKLTPSLLPKSKYVLHYRTLQLYSRLGMVVTAVHKVLGFQQSAWMAPYINLNTALRTRATTDFEKSFYKVNATVVCSLVCCCWLLLLLLFLLLFLSHVWCKCDVEYAN